MNKRLLRLAIFFCAIFIHQHLSAQRTYYVDITKTSNGDGSLSNPWNNVLSAMYGSGAADTSDVIVYFRQGTYHLSADTTIYIGTAHNGSNGHYYTLRSYPGETVIFDGSKLTTDYSYMVSIAGASNIRLQGLQFANVTNITAYGIYISGGGSNIDLRGCTFTNLLWNSDTAEAKFPTSADKNIYPVYISGSGSLPSNILIDTNHFTTIAPGYYGSLVKTDGTPGTITQTANVDSNIISYHPRYQFYVSTTGSDTTGIGSKAKPWRTINFAVNGAGYDWSVTPPVLIDSNITIYLRQGIYTLNTSVYIGHIRGQNGKWTTITPYPGEWVKVDGGGLTAKYASMFVIDSAAYVNINGLEIAHLTDDSTLTTVVGGVVSKDSRFGVVVEGTAHDVSITNNEIHDMKWTRDTTKAKHPSGDDVLSAITVLGNTNTPITHLLIDNNDIHDIVPGYAEGVAINGNVDTFTVSGNEIYDIANIGLVAAGNYKWVLNSYPTLLKANNQSRNGVIKDNSVYRCISPVAMSAGIYLDGSLNITAQENTSYNNGVGISVGNEQDSSTSGGHLVIGNNVYANLGPGMYLGSNNLTAICTNVTVKYNSDSNNYTINPTLRQRANGTYGITDSSGRWAEIVMQRIQHLTFDENEIWSLSNNVLAFTFAQSALTFTYNNYYTKDNNACKAYFSLDTDSNGSTETVDTTFHEYARVTGLDTTSTLGSTAYNRHGCGTAGLAAQPQTVAAAATGLPDAENGIRVYPDPVVNTLSVEISTETAGMVRLELYDLAGRVLLRKDVFAGAGTSRTGWDDVKSLGVKPGVYILRVGGPVRNATKKILVL